MVIGPPIVGLAAVARRRSPPGGARLQLTPLSRRIDARMGCKRKKTRRCEKTLACQVRQQGEDMRVIKGACCLLVVVGIIIMASVYGIAEDDPLAWTIPVGVAVGLLLHGLEKVGRDHPSGHPYIAAPCYRVYAYGTIAVFVPLVGAILYGVITNDIINMPLEPVYLWVIGIAIELVVICYATNVCNPVGIHNDFDKQIKVLREMKDEKHKVYAPYDIVEFELEKVERIQKEHLDKAVINAMHMRDGLIYLHTLLRKRPRRK